MLEEEEDQDPEWADFDPEAKPESFFGRAIPNEEELRQELVKKKEEAEEDKKREIGTQQHLGNEGQDE